MPEPVMDPDDYDAAQQFFGQTHGCPEPLTPMNEIRIRMLEESLRCKLDSLTAEEWLARACRTEQDARKAVDSIGMMFLFDQSRLEFLAAEMVSG